MKKNNLKIVKIDKNKRLFNYEKKVLINNLILEHICFTSTCLLKGVDKYCFLKCFLVCRLFFNVGPGAIPLTLIFGANVIALVFVRVNNPVLLNV